MIDDYPVQRTNPARDLYKHWYQIIQYSSPYQLEPKNDTERAYDHAAFTFQSGHSLHVDRNPEEYIKGKPLLRIPGVFQIWPDGQFSSLCGLYSFRWCLAELKMLEKLTFLRWGYLARQKAVWVQDSPRRGYSHWSWGAANREHPDVQNFQRRTPYLQLDGTPLFDEHTKYRLKKAANDKWIIAASGLWHPRENDTVKDAQHNLDRRYARAERRYDWWQRRSENEKLRQLGISRSGRPAQDQAEIIRTFVDHSMVFEPKTSTKGQSILPFDAHREEAMSNG